MKTIVITGATGVLGNLVAKTFAERGHNLALLAKDQNKLDFLTRDLNLPTERLYTQAIDLLDGQAIHDSAEVVVSKLGSVHALIHLVGGWTGGKTIPESSADDFEFMLNQHAWTTFHLLHALQVQSIRLMTNNPKKIAQLEQYGVKINERLPHILPPNEHNIFYLETKAAKSGHMIDFHGKTHLPEQSDMTIVEGMKEVEGQK